MTSFLKAARLLLLALVLSSLSPPGLSSFGQPLGALDAGAPRLTASSEGAHQLGLPVRLTSPHVTTPHVRLRGLRPSRLALVSTPAPLVAVAASAASPAAAAVALTSAPRALVAPRPPPVL